MASKRRTVRKRTIDGSIIMESTGYRESYEEIPVEVGYTNIQFRIDNVHFNDYIYVKKKGHTGTKHYRVTWSNWSIPKQELNKKRHKEIKKHFEHDIYREYVDKDGKLVIEWKDSYISFDDISYC